MDELWTCESCEKDVPESETEWIETHRATREDPPDGVTVCRDCANRYEDLRP